MATAPDMQRAPSGKSKKTKKNRTQSGPPTAMMPNNTTMSGAVGGAPVPAAARQLEFHQAMTDFKTMFPSMDKDVIETVLRANNGAVDITIDQLLTMAADMPETPQEPQHPQLPQYGDPMNMGFSSPPPGITPVTPDRGQLMMTSADKPPPYSPPSPNSPFSQEMLKRQLPQTPVQRGLLPPVPPQNTPSPFMMAPQVPHTMSSPSEPITGTQPAGPAVPRRRRWNPPLIGDLPVDFLRVVPGKKTQAMVSAQLQERMEMNVRQRKSIDIHDVEMQQMLEDERFALTLQNEEFMHELQRNPEFIAALDRDYSQSVTVNRAQGVSQVPPSASQVPPSASPCIVNNLAPSNQVTPQGEVGAAGGISSDDIEFRNKLTHMGKTTRYKFTQMAKMFNKKKKRTSRTQLDGQPASSMLNLLDDYDESGDTTLLGTRQEVKENFYSDMKPFRV